MKLFSKVVLCALFFPGAGYSQIAERFFPAEEVLAPALEGVGQKDFYAVLTGQGEIAIRTDAGRSVLGGAASELRLEAGGKTLELWLRANRTLLPETKQISWWTHSRSLPFFDAKIVLESPEGKLLLFKGPATGNSPWTRYAWSFPGRGEPEKEMGNEKASGSWRFRGWVMRFVPFTKGILLLGEVGLSKKDFPAIPKTAWSLRDVDLDKTFMGAYSGFRIGFDGLDDNSVPLGLLLSLASNAANFSWQIISPSGDILDGGQKDLSETSPAAGTSLFLLPALPPGNYWMRVKTFSRNRELTSRVFLSYLVHRSTIRGLPKFLATGNFDVMFPGSGDAFFRGKGAGAKTISIKVDPSRGAKTLEWILKNGRMETVEEGKASLQEGALETKITFNQKPSGPERFELTLRAKDESRLVDERFYPIDIDEESPAPAFGRLDYPEKKFWLRETDARSIRADQAGGFTAFARHAAKNGSQIFLSCNWDEVEPAPGLIQFPIMDQRISESMKLGVPVNLTLFGHLDHLPRWLWYEQLLDQTGQNRQYNGSYTRKPSPVSDRTTVAYTNTIRRMVQHYKNESAVVGWNFSQGVESFWSDASRNGSVVDGSVAAEKAFGSPPPAPIFSGGLDLRPAWLAWESFKASVPAKYFDRVFSAVRAEDSSRPIYQYAGMGAGDLNNYLPVFRKHKAVLCFGAGESTVSAFNESLCLQAGVHLDAESSAVPPYPPTLLLTLFHKLAYGSVEGGFNIFWGRFFNPDNKEQVDGALTASKWISLIERVGASAPVSSGVAVGVGMRSVVNRSRSFMWIDWVNLNTYEYGDMLTHVMSLSLQTPFVTEASPAETLSKHRAILFLEAPLLDEAAGRRLVEYVRAGGNLLLQGETGRYNLAGEESRHLKKAFGLSFDKETPYAFGRGKVAWLKAPISFRKSKNVLKEFFPWAEAKPPLSVKHPSVRHALRISDDGKKYFMILFGKTWEGGNPSKDQLAADAIQTTARLDGIPEGKWRLSDLGSGEEIGVETPESLEKGIAVSVKPAELKILKLEKK